MTTCIPIHPLDKFNDTLKKIINNINLNESLNINDIEYCKIIIDAAIGIAKETLKPFNEKDHNKYIQLINDTGINQKQVMDISFIIRCEPILSDVLTTFPDINIEILTKFLTLTTKWAESERYIRHLMTYDI